MTRYFFDLPAERDEVGMELKNDAASRLAALRYASDLIREIDPGKRGQEYWRVDVRREEESIFSVVLELLPVKKMKAEASPRHLRLTG